MNMEKKHRFGAIQTSAYSTSKQMIEYNVDSADEEWALKEGSDGITMHLFEYLKRNMVGKLIPQPGNPSYFTPKWKRGPLVLSIQLNYSLWDLRTDNRQPLDSPMTASEFEQLRDSLYDFAAWCDGTEGKVTLREPGQMSLMEISEFIFAFFTGAEDRDSGWYEPDDDWDDDWINDYDDWDDDDY